MIEIRLKLPYPPSVNHYWKHGRGRAWIGEKGQKYRKDVRNILLIDGFDPYKPITGNIKIDVYMYPPDRRKRDADNIIKAVFDALQHAGLYKDDYQITGFAVTRLERVAGGYLDVRIMSLD